jgi:hypothetical protein
MMAMKRTRDSGGYDSLRFHDDPCLFVRVLCLLSLIRDVVNDILSVGMPLTHQRDSARRRHLIELLLIQREGMSELSHDG